MADGFKNTTRTQYFKGGDMGTKGAAKVAKVMGDFKRGAPVKKAMGGPVLPPQANGRAAQALANRTAAPAGAPSMTGNLPAQATANSMAPANTMPNQLPAAGTSTVPSNPAAQTAVGNTGQLVPNSMSMTGTRMYKKGGNVTKKAGGGPVLPAQANSRATQAVASRPAMPAQADNAKRITTMKNGGSMSTGATVARGNRMQALEAAEEAKLLRDGRTAPVRGGGTQNRALGRGAAADGPVMKPIKRSGGGLAVMPRGKKC